MSPPVVTLTLNPSVDLYTAVDRVEPEHKLRCDAPDVHPGGGGINTARVMGRFGCPAIAVHTVGGRLGQWLRDLLAAEGVEERSVAAEGGTRENLTVLDRSLGRQFRFVMPGAPLQAAEWRRCVDEVAALAGDGAVVLASGSLPPGVPDDVYARVAEVVRERGGRLVLDAAGAPLRAALDVGVDLVAPNRRELDDLVGTTLDADARVAAAAGIVAEGRAGAVVVKLDADGALAVGPDGHASVAAPAVSVRSAVGAGDSFMGALLVGLVHGVDLADATRLAVAAGSAAVMTPGTELCRMDDVVRLWAAMTADRPFPVPLAG